MISSAFVATAVCALAAFLICGIPFGLLIAKHTGNIDVRKVGSGNIGMTNVARSAGGSAAAATLLCDVIKGTVSVLLARVVFSQLFFAGSWAETTVTGAGALSVAVVYAACVMGHVFSPYLGFHGGKGISVGFGAALGQCWPVALGLLAVFVCFAVPSRYVSLGSIMAAVSLPVWGLVMGLTPVADLPLLVVAAVVVWAHRSNIKKLLAHEERTFTIRKK